MGLIDSFGAFGLANDATKKIDEAKEKRDTKKKKKGSQSKVTEAVQAGVSGAATGASVGGVPGAVVGTGLGIASTLIDANRADKAQSPSRPKRRRLSAVNEQRLAQRSKKEAALATLSQAVFDWAASIR